jgi:hypothetical protein
MVAFNNSIPAHRFPLGQVVATPAAVDLLAQAGQDANELLARHQAGDWGVVDADDRQANDEAITDEGRLMSVYALSNAQKVWIITEADRSSTCILTPDDY